LNTITTGTLTSPDRAPVYKYTYLLKWNNSMKLITSIFAASILLSLNAWSESPNETTIDWKSAKEVKSLVELKLDPELGEVTYGPNFALSDNLLMEKYSEIYLTRRIDPKNEESYSLFVTAHDNDQDWHSYDTATKKDGERLGIETIVKNENVSVNNVDYKHEEQMAISMTFIDFADGFDFGLELTISGNQKDTLMIPATYFRAMLQSM